MSRWLLALLALVLTIGLIGGYFMAHGTPDWYGAGTTKTIHQVTDLGELAARLGSPDTYDRRGNVVLIESFEDGFAAWIREAIGTGASIELSTKSARTGAYSARLTTGTTASMMTGVSKYTPRPVLGQIGLEASFAAVSADPAALLSLHHYTGAGYYRFQLRYDYATELLEFFGSDGNWHTVASALSFYPERRSYNSMKLVVDLVANEYSRVLFVDNGYALSGEGGFWVGGASAPYLAIGVYAVGDTGGSREVYLDDVILTQNEP